MRNIIAVVSTSFPSIFFRCKAAVTCLEMSFLVESLRRCVVGFPLTIVETTNFTQIYIRLLPIKYPFFSRPYNNVGDPRFSDNVVAR